MPRRSADGGHAGRRTTLVLTGWRPVLKCPVIRLVENNCEGIEVDSRDALRGRRGRRELLAQGAQHARVVLDGGLAGSVLIIAAVADDQDGVGRQGVVAVEMSGNEAAQNELQRERISRHHGKPWPDPPLRPRQAQHGQGLLPLLAIVPLLHSKLKGYISNGTCWLLKRRSYNVAVPPIAWLYRQHLLRNDHTDDHFAAHARSNTFRLL